MQYDELGLASIPETWVQLYEVGVEHVHTVEEKRLTLRQRSSNASLQLQQGSIGKLLASVLSQVCMHVWESCRNDVNVRLASMCFLAIHSWQGQ